LTDALLVNPYAVDEFAEVLRLALTMPEAEQERRMRQLRAQVLDNNIFRWAGMLLSEAGKLVRPGPEEEASHLGNGKAPSLAGAAV
jgi:trehalose 6-phosphate synthase